MKIREITQNLKNCKIASKYVQFVSLNNSKGEKYLEP